eukprot:jgi/Chrzof1/7887/Cz02g40020.t1
MPRASLDELRRVFWGPTSHTRLFLYAIATSLCLLSHGQPADNATAANITAANNTLNGSLPMGVQSKQYINNLKGDLLVLSVNQVASWLTSDNTTGITSGTQLNITTPDECEQQCALVPGCNGWNFCNRTDGCGIGCLEYHIHTEPYCDCTPLDLQLCIPAGYQLPITSSLHTSTPFNTSQQNTTLPLNSTSDYNGTLLPNPANSTYCHGDAWPQYTCTLLTNVSGASPEFWPNTTEDGWVSGTLQFAGQCMTPGTNSSNVTAYECDRYGNATSDMVFSDSGPRHLSELHYFLTDWLWLGSILLPPTVNGPANAVL